MRFKAVLQRIDHSTIFIFIAATMTPIALVIVHGALAWVTLAIAWTGAAAGVAFSLGWVNAPRAVTAGSYLLLGWVAVIMLPQVLGELTIIPLLLLAAGGLLYSVGAFVFSTQRPNPWPRTFGFHEVFHVLVIAAAAVHLRRHSRMGRAGGTLSARQQGKAASGSLAASTRQSRQTTRPRLRRRGLLGLSQP